MFEVGNIINFKSQRIIKRKRNHRIRIRKIIFKVTNILIFEMEYRNSQPLILIIKNGIRKI